MSIKSFLSKLLSGNSESKVPPRSQFGPGANRSKAELEKQQEWDRAVAHEQGNRTG